ncbi:MAG: nucleoside triphosphate pyrophosphohydrolase [Spirochaetaceae bacterium]
MDKNNKVYNKLVRDKIPEIILNVNKKPITRVLSTKEYEFELTRKLQEELNEFKEDSSIEELADLQTVINAILIHRNIDRPQFDKLIEKKNYERGGFEKRIFLETVEV